MKKAISVLLALAMTLALAACMSVKVAEGPFEKTEEPAPTVTAEPTTGPTAEPTAEPKATAEPTPVPTPMPAFELLEISSRGDGVQRLQQKLIDLGYLEGTADGRYGEMTSKAVKAAQADFGMEQTGRADVAFQQRLFSE